MRNRDTIKAIMPNGRLAKDTSALRHLHPLEYNLPLTGDNDLSFWSTYEDTVDHEEEPAAEDCCTEPAAASPTTEHLDGSDHYWILLPVDPA